MLATKTIGYSTLKLLVDDNLLQVCWLQMGDGMYVAYTSTDVFFAVCCVPAVSTADFEATLKAANPFNSVESEDDAYVRCFLLNGNRRISAKDHEGTPIFSLPQVQSDDVPKVAIASSEGAEQITCSHNFGDRCSWFGDSGRVVDETLTDSGDGLTWTSANTHWIDMISGRVHDDDGFVTRQRALHPEDPHGYEVIVKVDGTTKTMREPFETSGGDYEVIWELGRVHFFASQAGHVVTASYSYAQDSTFYLRPDPGTILQIVDAEVGFTSEVLITDTVVYAVWGVVDVLAPYLMEPPTSLPSGTMIPASTLYFKRLGQILAEAKGNYPLLPALGATAEHLALPLDEFRRVSRGTKNPMQELPFRYSTRRDLFSSAQLELRVYTLHHRPMSGEHLTITFYCTVVDDPYA